MGAMVISSRIVVLYQQQTTRQLLQQLLSGVVASHFVRIEPQSPSGYLPKLLDVTKTDFCLIEETVVTVLGETMMSQLLGSVPTLLLRVDDTQSLPSSLCFADILSIHNLSAELLKRSIRYIREQQKHQQRLQELVLYDDLTKLINRRHFQHHLSAAIAHSSRRRHSFALLLIDLDRFKLINDSFGHEYGDEFLTYVSETIKHNLRQEDIAARLGNDEFAILLETRHAQVMAERLLRAFAEPFELQHREMRIHASIGIACFPQDGNDNSQLMKAANSAMMLVKQRGGGALGFYETTNQNTIDQSWIEREFYNAFNNGHLYLQYQPQVSADKRQCLTLEALCRWHDPEKGLIPPDIFIPAIEKTPMIIDLERWILESVCRELAVLQSLGKVIKIAVNISMVHICHSNFVDELKQTLALTGAYANQLEIELTESALMVDPLQTISTLKSLRELGVTIAIDDFGTGHSSLAYLVDLPIDILKIDRIFVRDCLVDRKRDSVIRAIIALARSLGLKTVAEGVEDEQTIQYLTDLGCNLLQGFYFGKPMLLADALRKAG